MTATPDVVDVDTTAHAVAVEDRFDPAAPLPLAGDGRSWKQLRADAADCTACPLSEGRRNVVFGDGNRTADLVIVGDAPGPTEDLLGKPFVGAAGNLLDNLLIDIGLPRADVYVTSLVKCFPRDTAPQRRDVTTCTSRHLVEELAHVDPRVVVSLGPVTTSVLLQRPAPIDRVAGFRFSILGGVTLIPTEHPATVIKGKHPAISTLRRDLLTAKAVLDGRLAPAAESSGS